MVGPYGYCADISRTFVEGNRFNNEQKQLYKMATDHINHNARLIKNKGLNSKVTQNLRIFISGSAPLLEETFLDFNSITGHKILERYGMTETNMCTSNPYDEERIAGTVGLPLPGVELRIADDQGNEIKQGEIGIIELRGENVFKGYWQMPDKTNDSFRKDGFFITGDMAKIDHKGYVTIVGRDKDLIITGGLNVYPKEVETVIDQIESILESALFVSPQYQIFLIQVLHQVLVSFLI